MAIRRRAATEPQADLSRFQEGKWNLPRCFVIHAWSPQGMRHVISHIRNALKDNFHVFADFDFGAGEPVREQALERIRTAALVVAILDDLRPNVVFELGYARALGKPCVPLVREGAQVNVLDYYAEGKRAGIVNPPLDVDKHFSDLKDLKRCKYDHEDPKAPAAVLGEELKNSGADGKTLARRVLEAWVQVLKEQYGPEGKCFDGLYAYILQSTIALGTPLFATHRKKRFDRLFEEGAVCSAAPRKKLAKPPPLPDAVIEAAADLPHQARLALVRKLLASYPKDPRLRFAECYAAVMVAHESHYVNLAQSEEALRLHKDFLEAWPENAEAHNNYANLLMHLKRPTEAEDHYEEALRINSEYAQAHKNYAILLADLKRPEEAEDHYKEALRINPEYANAWANLGRLYQVLGRKKEAQEAYEKALTFANRLSPGAAEKVREGLSELGEKGA
jgi:tetratricopeptide (TPR) repeat protein